MQVEIFREEDEDEVSEWLKQREIGPLDSRVLSRTGAIVKGVACGFLYATDSRLCFLDFFISNPKAEYEARRQAMDEIANHLIGVAKERQYIVIIAGTDHAHMQDRCGRLGFTPQGSQQLYTMEINR